MGERADQRGILLGSHLLEQAHRHQEERRLVVVELQRWQQAALADPPATAGFLDIDTGAVAKGRDVALYRPRVHLQLVRELPGRQSDLGFTEAREELDDSELLLSLLVRAWHGDEPSDSPVPPTRRRGCSRAAP